ncbi:MAG: hypothetical protein HYV77_03265 [Candidatus Wildermuthbacteria bacterium]|nr:hypothetical protein [Candidatus Wildermuthbacteria bacterium]
MPEVSEVIEIITHPDRCPKMLQPLRDAIRVVREKIFGPTITVEWTEYSTASIPDQEEDGPMVMSY